MPPKKALSKKTSSSSKTVGDASPTSAKSASDTSDASPVTRTRGEAKRLAKKKAAEEAKRKAEERKAELKIQQAEANRQLRETIALKDRILESAMFAANANNGSLGTGFRHSCVMTEGGGLVCFGTSGRGQSDVPHASVTGYRPYEAVACGHLHTCAATVTGQLVFFGDNSFGQCSPPPRNKVQIKALCAGFGHSCVLDSEGHLQCFGDNLHGQCNVPIELASTTVVSIAAGFHHTCAVTAQGALLCFGDNSAGQCAVPLSLNNVRLVAAGEFHTCAVTAKGKLHCFGRNDYGQCNVPKDLENVIAVAAGSNFTMALLMDGTVWCGGSTGHGQCDLPGFLLPEAEEEEEFEEEEEEEEVLEVDVDVSCEVQDTEEIAEMPETEPSAEKIGQSYADTTLSSLISEVQESLTDPEDEAKKRMKAVLEKLVAAWEDAEAFAAKYVDRFRGLSASCLHSCLLLTDGKLLFFGDDSANQCFVPEGLVPKVSDIDEALLPRGILADLKPKLLQAEPPEAEVEVPDAG